MSFVNPIFGLRKFIYENIRNENGGLIPTSKVNEIVEEASKVQQGLPYNGELITPELLDFIKGINKPLRLIDVDLILDKLLPYFRVDSSKQKYTKRKIEIDEDGEEKVISLGRGSTKRLFVNVGTASRYISFIPDKAELGAEQLEVDDHDSIRGLKTTYEKKGNILNVSISRLQKELEGGRFTKSLQIFYDGVVETAPFDINIPKRKTRDRLSFLRKLVNTAEDVLDATREDVGRKGSEGFRTATTPTTEEGQMEKFQKEWPNLKKEIAKLVPLGRVPSQVTFESIASYLSRKFKKPSGQHALDLLAAPLFSKNSPLEEELETTVSERASSPTYGELIFRAILMKAGANAFQTVNLDEDYMDLTGGDDSFFDRKPEITDTRQRVEPLPLPEFNGRRFVFTSPNGDDIIYYTSGVITAEQVGRRLPEGYKLDREETIKDVVEFQKLARADRKKEERLKQRLENEGLISEINLDEFYSNLEAMAEQLRRREPRGKKLRDRDYRGRAISPSGQRFSRPDPKKPVIEETAKFYFHPFDTDVELDPELFKMKVSDLPEDERRRVKTFLQDAEPTEYFGEEYLKLTKLINTLADVVDSSEEEELEGLDEENLKLIKKLAHLRKRYEKLYQEIYGMVYGEEE